MHKRQSLEQVNPPSDDSANKHYDKEIKLPVVGPPPDHYPLPEQQPAPYFISVNEPTHLQINVVPIHVSPLPH
jgi:hypothetical protein